MDPHSVIPPQVTPVTNDVTTNGNVNLPNENHDGADQPQENAPANNQTSAIPTNQDLPPTQMDNLHPLFSLADTTARSRKYKLAGREASLWGFYEHVSGNTYSCVLCRNTSAPVNNRDKRHRKGITTYTSSTGTTSLRRHLTSHHAAELDVHTKALEEDEYTRRKKRRLSKKGSSVLSMFNTHKNYDEDSVQQKMHDHDLVLLVGKAALPLSIVENPYFRRYVHGRNPRVKVPSRRKLTEKLVPQFIQECSKKFISPRLSSFQSVTITFDLWMSRGTQDIFDLIAHGMDDNFQQQQVHLRMVECNETTGLALAEVLQEELDKWGLTKKVIACVKDGGSNLTVCTQALRNIVSCDILGLNMCFEGRCMAHVLSGACNSALAPDNYADLHSINFKSVRATLQKCITWTKKSGKGKSEWYKSCRQMNMKERLVPTPVKTRFVSTVVMLKMMLNYRQVVQHCFSNQPSPELRTRVPSTETWEIASVVVSALEPIMDSCILFQRKEGWLISDAVQTLGKLYLHYNNMLHQITLDDEVESAHVLQPPPGASLDDQLKIYQRKIAITLIDRLEPMIKPLMELTQIDDSCVHHYLALALDPKYKQLRYPFMALHAENIQRGRQLAKNYDEIVILPLLGKLKGVDLSENTPNPAENTTSNQSAGETTEAKVAETQLIDCFVTEGESPQKTERKLLLNELMGYRREPFEGEKLSRPQWLSTNQKKYPTVTLLARQVLSIPPTQIDNERIFSLAGRIASPLRSSISTQNIDNLVCIARNYPDGKVVDDDQYAYYNSLEEFSDFLLSIETPEDIEEIQQ